MRIFRQSALHRALQSEAGFTFTEMVITVPLVMMAVGMALYGHLFGLKMFEITKAKLSATDDARQAINLMMDEIRGGAMVDIGNGNATNFTEIAVDTLQRGSAIRIFTSREDTNQYVIYFWDSASKTLSRSTNGSAAKAVMVNSITNSYVFTSEDYKGTVLSNNYNNRVIGVNLEFYQIQYPVIKIGPGEYYDRYMLHTKITRRALSDP